MNREKLLLPIIWPLLCGLFLSASAWAQTSQWGFFEDHRDIGAVQHAGSVEYDAEHQTYLVAGGGENMWLGADAFHFVWKRLSGDFVFSADVQWIGTGGNAHRKACLMIRQGLEAGSPYVDAAAHGDGLTSLQFRETSGGPTREVQSNVTKPRRLRIERQGDTMTLSLAGERAEPQATGCSFRLKLQDPVYVGLAVCAHDNKVIEKALFSNVSLTAKTSPAAGKPILHSTLESVAIASKDRKAVYHTLDRIEAPNWSRDGKYFIFNGKGRLFKLPLNSKTPELLDTGFATRCNNDHGLSPDGTQLAISDQSQGGKSLIYLLPIAGGTPTRITAQGPSYWHGWSPDGQTLVYCGERKGEFDIYAIPVTGGEEKRLTTAPGLDDGPEYSPDGQFIYFNSERSGAMQIWRMKADGSQPEQVTVDAYNNWFPHLSPDGRWLLFLSYDKDVKGHPENKEVLLRLKPMAGGEIQVLAKLFGGQGTINVPCWSPDSRQVAFVSYYLENK